ncbi:hypothetical protein MLD38_015062 [Melastoma candidum]|uniref:Uncharacterized protein n=1 Tax=Melastoma candidum TaxID=119954 RepID=A0ACB9REY8_9MYRT|nr:hypothetical protein MLD38_015062 [Melastoma candidum]
MGAKKPRVVIVGAGMAGITAANRLYVASEGRFEVVVVEGGMRIGGRINTCEFGGDRVEMGATWIHGVGGSPVYEIATRVQALSSEQPWECMDGMLEVSRTVAEDGSEVDPAVSERVSALFKSLMDFAQGKAKAVGDGGRSGSGHREVEEEERLHEVAAEALEVCKGESGGMKNLSIGSFLRKGLEIYWERNGYGKNWRRKLDEEAVFAMHENTQRICTSADDLSTLDFSAESEYVMCSGREITIAKGYSSIIESLTSVLPSGTIRLGWEVVKIDWRPVEDVSEIGHADPLPVTLHFRDGAKISADHVVLTVSLGVLKARVDRDSGLFAPPLPSFKTDSISRLGFGVVNKLFLQLPATNDRTDFPVLQLAFHRTDSGFKNEGVPWWMRRTASLAPIHRSSHVLLSWFAGKEALHLETLTDEEIMEGVSSTVDSMLPSPSGSVSRNGKLNPKKLPNGSQGGSAKFEKVLRSKWGSDPLFLGSYSYVAVGSSVDDVDALAEPLPRATEATRCVRHPLQILFAGEATHRTHYSTTHGAYFSGIREANRLLQHYYYSK